MSKRNGAKGMKGLRYPDEFRSEAVNQNTERAQSVADVAEGKGSSSIHLPLLLLHL